MSGNNPSNMVTVVLDEDVTIVGTHGCVTYPAGQKVQMQKSHYAHCLEPILVTSASAAADKQWFVTIPAGDSYETEVPGGPFSLTVEATGALAYLAGTAEVPLNVPENLNEVKENAPELLSAGTNTLSLKEGAVNRVALINPGTEDVKTQLTWKGGL